MKHSPTFLSVGIQCGGCRSDKNWDARRRFAAAGIVEGQDWETLPPQSGGHGQTDRPINSKNPEKTRNKPQAIHRAANGPRGLVELNSGASGAQRAPTPEFFEDCASRGLWGKLRAEISLAIVAADYSPQRVYLQFFPAFSKGSFLKTAKFFCSSASPCAPPGRPFLSPHVPRLALPKQNRGLCFRNCPSLWSVFDETKQTGLDGFPPPIEGHPTTPKWLFVQQGRPFCCRQTPLAIKCTNKNYL
jgi:hypothetical protein